MAKKNSGRKKRTSVHQKRTSVHQKGTLMGEGSLLEVYYEYPERNFSIRELSRMSGLSKSAVQKRLIKLRWEGMVTETNGPSNSSLFRVRKIHHYIEKIVRSGLVERIKEETNPSCIVLFGSFRKGESAHGSDIDIFAETSQKRVPDLSPLLKEFLHKQ